MQEPYVAPEWSLGLTHIPISYIKLAQRPTPIHAWNLPDIPAGYHVSIKRDDMTGSTLGGSKARKLEFLLAEAIRQNCDCVITGGGLQSNFCRAAAVACRQLGLECHVLLRCPGDKNPLQVQCDGNLLLSRLVGAHIVLVTPAPYEGKQTESGYIPGLKDKMESLASELRSIGRKPYLMPPGGSSPTGLWGYIEAFREMMDQGMCENFDDLIVTMGSGGTPSALAIANYLTGSKLRIHAVLVVDITLDEAYELVDKELRHVGLAGGAKARDIINITNSYNGKGYSIYTDQDAEQLITISGSTGIFLDPTYTNKAAKGMLNELVENPSRFKGKRILFMNTGAAFGLYNQRISKLTEQHELTSRMTFDAT